MQEAEKVYLKKISLENFRCFEKVEADLQKKLTLVVGANGAGKTSLLESIAIAMSTMFTAFDGSKAMNITRKVLIGRHIRSEVPITCSHSIRFG